MDPIEIGAILPFVPASAVRYAIAGFGERASLFRPWHVISHRGSTIGESKANQPKDFLPKGHSQSPLSQAFPQLACPLTYCGCRAHSLGCGRGFGVLEAERISFKLPL
jgi:hypothetical protein